MPDSGIDNILFKAAVHQCDDIIVMTTDNGTVMYANPAFEKQTGYKLKELKGKNVSLIRAGIHDSAFYDALASDLKKGKSVSKTFISKKKNGDLFYESKTITPIRSKNGKIEHFLSTSKDITKEFKLQENLVSQSKLIHSIIKKTNVIIVGLDKKANIVLFNGTAEKVTGYKFREVKGKNVFDVFIPSSIRSTVKKVFKGVLDRAEKFKNFENVWIAKNKDEILIRWSNTMLDAKDGNGIVVLSTGIDITAQKENESKLISQNQKLDKKVKQRTKEIENLNDALLRKSKLLDKVNHNLPAIIYLLYTRSKKITLLNNIVTEHVLFPADQQEQMDFNKFIDYFSDLNSGQISIRSFCDDSRSQEYVLNINNKNYYVQNRSVVFESDAKGKPFIYLGFITDVSFIKKIQNRLEESQKIARTGTWDWNLLTNELYWSKEMYRIFDTEDDDFTSSTQTISERIYPEDIIHITSTIRSARENKTKFETEFRILDSQGSKKHVLGNGYFEYDGSGQATRMIGTVQDITESKIHKQELQRNLVEKEILLKEIHHRVKNNLQIISSLLKLQLKKTEDPKVKMPMLESIERIRAIALVHEKLYLSKDIATLNFSEYLLSITSPTEILNREMNVQIKYDLEEFITDINVAIPLGLACYEIISNAFKHAFRPERKSELIIGLTSNQNGQVIKIKDNGIGFNINTIDFSKSLGWNLIKNLVKQANGMLSIVSEQGAGSEFTILLPIKFKE